MAGSTTDTAGRITAGQLDEHRAHGTAGEDREPADATSTRTYFPVLDVLRIVAVCGVVVIHVVGPLSATDGLRNPGWYAAAALNALSSWAVPVFVMISGALILRPASFRRGNGDFLARRAGRILPALVVWTLVYELINWREDGGFSGAGLLGRLLDGTSYSHLYFLWLIAGLYLLAPVLWTLLERGGAQRAWLLGGGAALWSTLVFALIPQWHVQLDGGQHPVDLNVLTLFLPWIGYFVLGRAALLSRIPRVAGVLLLCAFALLQAWAVTRYITLPEPRGDFWSSPPRSLRPQEVLASLTLFAGVWALARTWRAGPRAERILKALGQATFGVFLTHFLFVELLTTVIPGAGTDPQHFPALLVVAAGTIILSFAAALLLNRVPGVRRIV